MRNLVGIFVMLVISSSVARAQVDKESPKQIEPRAEQLLKEMSQYLSKQKAFTFTAASSTELVTKDGEKLSFDAESAISVERPNKVRSDRKGVMTDVSFYYDGKQIALYGKGKKHFATAKAPSTIDETIDFAREKFHLEAAGADLLYSNTYSVLMEDVQSGKYIGETQIDGKKVHHLAFRASEVDWQIWITDGAQPIPVKFVITSKKEPSAPQFVVHLEKWNSNPKFTPNHFTFVPPKDAQRVALMEYGAKKTDIKEQR